MEMVTDTRMAALLQFPEQSRETSNPNINTYVLKIKTRASSGGYPADMMDQKPNISGINASGQNYSVTSTSGGYAQVSSTVSFLIRRFHIVSKK